MEEFKEIILGEGVTPAMFVAYYFMGLLGLITSIMFDIYSSGIEMSEFKFRIFWKDNKIRLYLSLIVIVIGVLFSEQLLGGSLNTWTAFLSGFMSDKIIENLMQRRKKRIKPNSNDKQGR